MLNSVTPASSTISVSRQRDPVPPGANLKLVVCAINGHAGGGGLEIAMAADIRIARKNAGKVGLPEINLGVRRNRRYRLTRLIGAKALEMMVTGELMSFEDAHACNLINHIWEGDPTISVGHPGLVQPVHVANKAVMPLETSSAPARRVQKFPEYHLALERELQAALSTAAMPKRASPLTLRAKRTSP